MKSLYKIFHPEIFQGSLQKRDYFEGWYFKHVSESEDDAFAVIPGISLSDDKHAFIQFVDGKSGKSDYFRYDVADFRFDKKKLSISVGNSHFTTEYVSLDLRNNNIAVSGRISYSEMVKIPSGILSPGIMGWYSYVPTMECNHGVISVSHHLQGSLTVNSNLRQFSGGKGYIEKDWGISFPESWLWLQCNNFHSKSASVMISIAKIPWKKRFFIGFVAFISLNGKTTVMATYNGARVESLKRIDESKTEIVIRKGDLSLNAVVTKNATYPLKAPASGLMKNIIKESIDSDVDLELMKSGNTLFSEKGIFAGYEETEAIFSYF